MSKITFQRLVAIVMIISVIFIDVPSVFKDLLMIFLSLVFFLSTFNLMKKKKEEDHII